jgi:tetratricopeptide (TPR) repeat protein
MSVCGYQTLQHFAITPLYAYVTFGKWNDILDYPQPVDDRPYMKAVWHYARAMAFISKNELEKAEQEITHLNNFINNKEIDELIIWGINSAGLLIKIASEVSMGELEAKKKNYNSAITHLEKAVELEDQLRYDEPPTWFYPCRQNLGAVLIEAGRNEDALIVYEENLSEIPNNGWGLFGLQQALQNLGRIEEANEIEKQFIEAWKYSDIKLNSSRIL